MAGQERKSTQKQEEADSKNRTRRKESETLFDQINEMGQDVLTIGATPFQPPVERHAALLAKVSQDPQRANLILRLQRTYGNAYVRRLLASHAVQSRLSVSRPGDQYEQEAERVSEIVTREINSQINRQPEEEEEELQVGSQLQSQPEEEEEEPVGTSLQRQPEEEEEELAQMQLSTSHPATSTGNLETRIDNARGSGQPLSEVIREPMERAFGADFSNVKVHTDAEADVLNQVLDARAFTTGQDIFFRDGEYSPGSGSGQKLIAHELTHVVQQTGRRELKRQANKKKSVTNSGRVNFGSRGQQRLFASSKRVKSPNLFASWTLKDRVQVEATDKAPGVQRYITTANWFTGLFTGNRVRLNSSITGASLAKAMRIKKDATNLRIGSEPYTVNGSVEASGRADQVGQYKVGFLQTVYDSRRIFYYSPPKPGLLARILPSIFGNRTKVTDLCTTLPVRDGDAGKIPWYGMETVKSFDAAKTSTKETGMYDRPSSVGPWKRTVDGKTQYLVKTSGQDIFRSWLAVQNTDDNTLYRMNYIDWKVDYGADVSVNTKNLADSTVTPNTGGAQILGINEGPGSKSPLTGDPVANDVASDVGGSW